MICRMPWSSKPLRAAVRGPRVRLCRILSQLHDVIEHRPVARRSARLVVLLQRRDQLVIQCHPTQKLCVRFDSIVAPVVTETTVAIISCCRRVSGKSGDISAPNVAKAW